MLFNEAKYASRTWNIIVFSGFPQTLPTIKYHNYHEKYKKRLPEVEEIAEFVQEIYKKVRPPSECIIVALIYIERLMVIFNYFRIMELY